MIQTTIWHANFICKCISIISLTASKELPNSKLLFDKCFITGRNTKNHSFAWLAQLSKTQSQIMTHRINTETSAFIKSARSVSFSIRGIRNLQAQYHHKQEHCSVQPIVFYSIGKRITRFIYNSPSKRTKNVIGTALHICRSKETLLKLLWFIGCIINPLNTVKNKADIFTKHASTFLDQSYREISHYKISHTRDEMQMQMQTGKQFEETNSAKKRPNCEVIVKKRFLKLVFYSERLANLSTLGSLRLMPAMGSPRPQLTSARISGSL